MKLLTVTFYEKIYSLGYAVKDQSALSLASTNEEFSTFISLMTDI